MTPYVIEHQKIKIKLSSKLESEGAARARATEHQSAKASEMEIEHVSTKAGSIKKGPTHNRGKEDTATNIWVYI